MFNLKKLFAEVRGTIRPERDDLEKSQARLSFLETAPACRSDVEAAFDEYDSAARAEYESRMTVHISAVADAGTFNSTIARATCLQPVSPVVHQIAAQHRDLSIVLVGLFGDQVRAARAKLLDAYDWSRSGPPMAERAGEVERLKKNIAKLKVRIAEFESELRSAVSE